MAKKCLFERTSGAFVSGSSFDDFPHDPGTHVQIDLDEYPEPDQRWDGATGVRSATTQELADADDAVKDERSQGELDTAVLKVIRDLLLDIEQRLRAAGQSSTISSVVAATNKAEYLAALKDIHKNYQ